MQHKIRCVLLKLFTFDSLWHKGKGTCEGVNPTKTLLNPLPPIPENSRTMQRVQGFRYNNLVAAQCKSHLIQKVSEDGRAHTSSHSTRAADIESRTNELHAQ